MKNIEKTRSHILDIRKTEPELAPLADRALAVLQDSHASMASLAKELLRTGSPEARDLLHEACLPKALNAAFDAYVDMTRMYDLKQAVEAAVAGISRAIRDYPFFRGTAFATVADIRIREAIEKQCGDTSPRYLRRDVCKAAQKKIQERKDNAACSQRISDFFRNSR